MVLRHVAFIVAGSVASAVLGACPSASQHPVVTSAQASAETFAPPGAEVVPTVAGPTAVAPEVRWIGGAETTPARVPEQPPLPAEQLGFDGPAAPTLDEVVGAAQLAVTIPAHDGAKAELRIYVADTRGLTLATRIELATRKDEEGQRVGTRSIAWRDPESLVMLSDDGTLAQVFKGTRAPLARPAAHFRVSRAILKRADPEVPLPDDLYPHDVGLIATADGAVWVEHCAWYAYFGGEFSACMRTIYVRVLPTPRQTTQRPAARPFRALIPSADQGLTFRDGPLDPDKPPSQAMTCRRPGAAPETIEFESDGAPPTTWVSLRPPIAFIDTRIPEEYHPYFEHWLFRDCVFVEKMGAVVVGPSGFWATAPDEGNAIESRTLTVLWHGRVLGRIEGMWAAEFAPTDASATAPSSRKP